MADILSPDRRLTTWDECVYRIPRETFENVFSRGPLPPAERLMGIEVKVIEDADPDMVFVIDVKKMQENVHRMLFQHPADDFDPVAYKVAWGARIG